jgi:hypothetical protein
MPARSSALKILEVFGTGVEVSIIFQGTFGYTGTIIGIICSDRHHDEELVHAVVEPEFLLIKLTTVPPGAYVIGQTVAFNVMLIESIG